MIKTILRFLKSFICDHDWETVGYDGNGNVMYSCKKCGMTIID